MRQLPVTLGIGGVLHDFSVVVCQGQRVAGFAAAESVLGLSHGVDVEAMQQLFEAEKVERAIGMWLRTLQRAQVLDRTIDTALRFAQCDGADITAIGFCCPEALIPRRFRFGPQLVRVNHLDAHAAGTVQADPGDYVLVLDGIGDRGVSGRQEASALYRVDSCAVRLWTADEAASLGVLMDGANLLLGQRALERSPMSAGVDDYRLQDAAQVVSSLRWLPRGAYTFDGLTWRQMVKREAREAYLERVLGDRSQSARHRFALSVRWLTKAVVRRVAHYACGGAGTRLWLAGDVALHFDAETWPPEGAVRLSACAGDDGVALGAARLALGAIEDGC